MGGKNALADTQEDYLEMGVLKFFFLKNVHSFIMKMKCVQSPLDIPSSSNAYNIQMSIYVF